MFFADLPQLTWHPLSSCSNFVLEEVFFWFIIMVLEGFILVLEDGPGSF